VQNGLFDELTEIVSNSHQASRVLLVIAFPKRLTPASPKSTNWTPFWTTVCQQIESGCLKSGIDFQSLINAVAQCYPSNLLFNKFATQSPSMSPTTRICGTQQSMHDRHLRTLYVSPGAPLYRDATCVGLPPDAIPAGLKQEQFFDLVFEKLKQLKRDRELFVAALLTWPDDAELIDSVQQISASYDSPAEAAPNLCNCLGSDGTKRLELRWAELRSEHDKHAQPSSVSRDFEQKSFKEAKKIRPKVLLLTAVEIETRAVLNQMRAPDGTLGKVWQVTSISRTYYVGRLGSHPVVLTMSEMGSDGAGGATMAATSAIKRWDPNAIIMVGMAFGRDPQKQRLGDVLIATRIIPYELQRIDHKTVFRSPQPPCSPVLLDRFRNALDWQHLHADGSLSKQHFGAVLSGAKLVDDPKFKAKLFKEFPEANGGEMEANGVFSAAAAANKHWILVKAVCDHADGNKHDGAQGMAAEAATSLVEHVLNRKNVLDGL
jgi:nucleoside phosphorylase